jgi:hypothetical protein
MNRIAAGILFFAVLCPGTAVYGQTSPETAASVVRLLEGSGYRYSKLSASAWSITFTGKHKDSIQVLIIPDKMDLVLLAVIAERAQIDNNAPALRSLLKANAKLPEGLSVMLDNDNDYIVQSRSLLKLLNAADFKAALQAVAGAADDAYGGVTGNAPATTTPSGGGTGSVFSAPRGATQEIDLLNGRAAVWCDPAKWKETKSTDPGRRNFSHSSGDGYASIISERIEIPVEKLRDIALSNARQAAPDVRIVEEQKRRVNGTDVVLLRMEGSTTGIKFTYLGYYYGGPLGTIQVITWTGQNVFSEYRKDFEDFLNGFRLK